MCECSRQTSFATKDLDRPVSGSIASSDVAKEGIKREGDGLEAHGSYFPMFAINRRSCHRDAEHRSQTWPSWILKRVATMLPGSEKTPLLHRQLVLVYSSDELARAMAYRRSRHPSQEVASPAVPTAGWSRQGLARSIRFLTQDSRFQPHRTTSILPTASRLPPLWSSTLPCSAVVVGVLQGVRVASVGTRG